MNALIFGSKGSIGNYIFDKFIIENINCVGTTTNKEKIKENIIFVDSDNLNNLEKINNLDIVIWAQGTNNNDNIYNYNDNNFKNIIDGNVTFILNTLNKLLILNKLNKNCKMVIISSIWEEFTREDKLSYSVSKSALSGLVKNLSFDLGENNILINNVCPGVIDNEMSRNTLSKEQFEYIKNYTNFKRLINLDDVYRLIKFLVIENTAVTGQSIKIDLGFTNLKRYF